MQSKTRLARTGLALVLALATAGIAAEMAAAQAPSVDATCAGSLTMNFSPPVAFLLPPATGPFTVVTGTGSITTCAALDGGPTTGTFAYQVSGTLTCTSAGTSTGTLDIVWADASQSHVELTNLLLGFTSAGGAAGLTGTVTSGRFAGDQLQVANVRNPLAYLHCLLTGLSQTTGTPTLIFTNLE
jgi:hypothetical protein